MIVFKVEDHPEVRGIVIDGMAYLSAQVHDVGGIPETVGYAVLPPQPASLVSSEFADL
jgi:hypothetical protein